MPTSLIQRIGHDTLQKLESAAKRRHREGDRLRSAGERLGALYMYGYTIEIRLKTAYYRLAGVPLNKPMAMSTRGQAERLVKELHGPTGLSAGHDLIGWALLVEQTRVNHSFGPLGPRFAMNLRNHVQGAAGHWRELLRYRANRPYASELEAVFLVAKWVRRNHRELWS